MLPVLDPRRRSGDTHIVRQAGDAHVVFTVWAVAVVRVLRLTGELAQRVGVLGQGNTVGLHPLALTDRLTVNTSYTGFHSFHKGAMISGNDKLSRVCWCLLSGPALDCKVRATRSN